MTNKKSPFYDKEYAEQIIETYGSLENYLKHSDWAELIGKRKCKKMEDITNINQEFNEYDDLDYLIHNFKTRPTKRGYKQLKLVLKSILIEDLVKKEK